VDLVTRKRTERLLVTRVSADGHTGRRPDELIVEEPMTIQLDGVVVSTTMRTPGNDYELAAGFCHTEGLLAGAPVRGVRYCADGSAAASHFNVVTVETGGRAPTPQPRLGPTSSSCGWCGSDQIDELLGRLDPLPPTPPFDPKVLARGAGPRPRRPGPVSTPPAPSTPPPRSTATGGSSSPARTSAATTPSTRVRRGAADGGGAAGDGNAGCS
jgi:hypothetical protein